MRTHAHVCNCGNGSRIPSSPSIQFEAAARGFAISRNLATALATPQGKNELKVNLVSCAWHPLGCSLAPIVLCTSRICVWAQALFVALDSDGDGRISSKEWGHAISKNRTLAAKYFGGATVREIGAAFRRIDVDGSDDITWDE